MRILHILLPSAMFLSPARYAFTEPSVPPARGLRAPGPVGGPRGHGRGAGDPRRGAESGASPPRSCRRAAQRGGHRAVPAGPRLAPTEGGFTRAPTKGGFTRTPLRRALEEATFSLAPTAEAEAVSDLKTVRAGSPPRSVRFPQVAAGAVIAPRLLAASPGGLPPPTPDETFPGALGPGALTGKIRFLESARKD